MEKANETSDKGAPPMTRMTLDQAIVILGSRTKHWRMQTENNDGKRSYSCTVWNGDRPQRFTVQRATPMEAVLAALARMDGKGAKGLKLVGVAP